MTSPSGKKYIGVSTKGLEQRMKWHRDNTSRKQTSYAIHKAIKKYGFDNFSVEQIASGTVAECLRLEMDLIRAEQTRYPHGYNLTDGGEGCRGMVVSDETRQKLRVAITGKKPSAETIEKRRIANTGKKRSADFCARMGDLHRGKIVSPESLARMTAASRRRAADPVERARLKSIGTNHSAETLAKMSAIKMGGRHSDETRAKMSASHRARMIARTQTGERNAD